MSSASDIQAYSHSVEPTNSEVLFNSKKWTYIQDSTSNTGQYSGQILFNLSAISSQAAFVNWQEAFIELPIKLMITNGGTGNLTPAAAPAIDQLVQKNSNFHWVDSIQVVIDGVTVQTNQIHENVRATFTALTEWNDQYANKMGKVQGFALDDYVNVATSAATQSLDNLPTGNMINSTLGGEYGLSNTTLNPGMNDRSFNTSIIQAQGSLAYDVLGGNLSQVAKQQVYTGPTTIVAIPPGGTVYAAHYLATIRLADICDYFKRCPMQKNVKGFIYLNYNSSTATITTNANANVLSATTIASTSFSQNYGNTCPIMYNLQPRTSAGLNLPASSTLTITADVNGTPASGTNITPAQSFSRLLVPTYSPNPMADQALTMKKTFKYYERIVNKFNVAPGQSFTCTITNGIANPRRLIMMPTIGNATQGSTTFDTATPFRSCFSTVPGTTSPFCAIRNLQITVGNLPMYNNPVNFDYHQYLMEAAESGFHGGIDDEVSSGLITERQWHQLHRFITCDIGRRLPSEDGASKSIIVSGVNNTNYALTIWYHVLRDAVVSVDTAMGTCVQSPTQ